MSLRNKAIIGILAALVILIAVLYGTSRLILMNGLARIGEQETRESVSRTIAVVAQANSLLENNTADWAQWDESYTFVEDTNNQFIQSNLIDSTFTHLDLNMILFYDTSDRLVYGQAFDLNAQKETAIPAQLLAPSALDTFFGTSNQTRSSASGIILLDGGPVLVSAQPILRSDSTGPSRGTLLFGRNLDDAEIKAFSQLTLSDITMRRADSALEPDFREALGALSAGDPVFIRVQDERFIAGYTMIRDIRGNLAVVLKIAILRDVFSLGQTAIAYYILSVLGIGLIMAGIFIWIIQKQVLARFAVLIQGINNITEKGDTSSRISLTGRDELNLVAGTVNGMLAAIEDSAAAIKEREEQYRDLFDNATELIQSVTPEGRFIYVNNAWLKTMGYSAEEVKELTLKQIIHPEYLLLAREVNQKVIAGERINSLKIVLVTKSGEPITVESNVGARYKDGKVVEIRGIFRDVTERERASETLQQLYQYELGLRHQLEEEIQKRVEFTRALVHELKTPITPVLAAVDLLLEEVKDPRVIRLVQSIQRSSSNLNQRIDELLDLARGETGMLELEPRQMNLLLLLQNISYEMTPVAQRNKVTFTTSLPSSLPEINADEGRVRQVVVNLLNNAMKFTPEGGKINLMAQEDGDNITVIVEDNGPGISPEDQERLFQPYYRRIGDRERLSGLGLGLSLAKSFVELHGGRIWVDSRTGKGSSFGFSLPKKGPDIKKGTI